MSPVRPRLALCLLLAAAAGCRGGAHAAPRAPGTRATEAPKALETLFDSGLKGDWQDHGWADRAPRTTGPEKLLLAGYGGWQLAHATLEGRYGGLRFRFKAPVAFGDFWQVRLEAEAVDVFTRVDVGPQHRKDLADGWSEVFLSMAELNPQGAPFGKVVLRARNALPAPGLVEVDQLALTVPTGEAAVAVAARSRAGAFTVDCTGPGTDISPLIYGIAFSPLREYQSEHQWKVGATIRRWGGNPMSRYNWELGNAWNTASDYYYENVDYTGHPGFTWATFLASNAAHRVQTALTVPTIGWVAKDTRSVSFPVSEYGGQDNVDDARGAGNGSRHGKPLTPGPPTRTSVPAPPDFVGRWVAAIRQADAQRGGQRSVHLYILDNEPALWDDTHRDVHPEPLGYDELWDRTLRYATAVRKADPQGLIAGPAEWGWPNYTYSAVDRVAGYRKAPDRKAHGDVPLIEWYLQQVARSEAATGVKLLDVLDLHFYPQGKGIGVGLEGNTDAATNALRIRSTRGLWDPSYTDESWIAEPVRLIPRMRDWVAKNRPGLKLAIGEYSFGAERHPSGGLALAEALGRFGQEGLYAAFYWTYPPEGSPAFWAFRAYRDYDGQGGHFESRSLPTQAPPEASLFAARSPDGQKGTLVLLNFAPAEALEATVTFKGCPAVKAQRRFTYTGSPQGFAEARAKVGEALPLPPASISVLEVEWSR